MSNLAIFKQQDAVVSTEKRELSDLAKSLATASTSRRIATNTNGTFKRLVNGEQIGNAVRGELNVIILSALPKISRIYYQEKYDPNKEATLPNCWSNLGDKPEASATDKQHTNCADCPQNIQGSGEGNARACRYERRLAVIVEGDSSGDIYQFTMKAKSLFGKGTGNVHPFESYIKFLIANGESPDNVVTQISYDINADTMALLFTPLRNISNAEHALVREAQMQPEAKSYTMLTVAQTDKVTTLPKVTKKVVRPEEPEDEEEFEQVAKPRMKAAEPEDKDEVEPPVKRPSKKAAEPESNKANLADVVSKWSDD